jgi:hypothetical protein
MGGLVDVLSGGSFEQSGRGAANQSHAVAGRDRTGCLCEIQEMDSGFPALLDGLVLRSQPLNKSSQASGVTTSGGVLLALRQPGSIDVTP